MLRYAILYYTILYYTILYYTILCYATLRYTILYYTIVYYTVLYCTVLYCTILYCTVLYCRIRAVKDVLMEQQKKDVPRPAARVGGPALLAVHPYLSIYLYLSIHLSIYLSICLSIYLSFYARGSHACARASASPQRSVSLRGEKDISLFLAGKSLKYCKLQSTSCQTGAGLSIPTLPSVLYIYIYTHIYIYIHI